MLITVQQLVYAGGETYLPETFTFSLLALVSLKPGTKERKQQHSLKKIDYCILKLTSHGDNRTGGNNETFELLGTHDEVLAEIKKQAKAF